MLKNNLKMKTVKAVVNLVVGASVGFVVQSLIEAAIRPQNTRDKVKLSVGSYVIGGMVADASRAWTNQKIDGAADAVDRIKIAWDKAEAESDK